MEDRMPYQHCPSCRLTVRLDAHDRGGHPCPRCGDRLADEPASLFVEPPPTSRRFSRAASTLTPDAVRSVLAVRGGRYRRDGSSLPGRS
jgi:hypothetical protein